jgi:hypothetical protein
MMIWTASSSSSNRAGERVATRQAYDMAAAGLLMGSVRRRIALGWALSILFQACMIACVTDAAFPQAPDASGMDFLAAGSAAPSGETSVADRGAAMLDPSDVLRRSLAVPGWGQVTNRQIWKVPLVYGAFAGAAVYTSQLTVRYHDYRAAVYNITRGEESDLRFGATPAYIPATANVTQLQTLRDRYRNRRDFMFVAMGLIHGLQVLDAYVFAHMKSFDVSDDLSHRITLSPSLQDHPLGASPVLSMKIPLRSARR